MEFEELDGMSPIADVFCTLDLVKSGVWKVAKRREIPEAMMNAFNVANEEPILPHTIYGSRNITILIEAFNGLRPWDEMADPDYFTNMLLDGVTPPIKHEDLSAGNKGNAFRSGAD